MADDAYGATDLSSLIASTSTSKPAKVTEPLQVERARNVVTVDVMQKVGDLNAQSVNLADEIRNKNAQFESEVEAIKARGLQTSIEISQAAEQDVLGTRQRQTQLYQTRDELLTQKQDIELSRPNSFFANPVAFIGAKMKTAALDSKLGRIQKLYNESENQRDLRYAGAAQELRRLRSESMAVDYMTAQLKYRGELQSLGIKLQRIVDTRAALRETQTLSQQRTYRDPNAEIAARAGRQELQNKEYIARWMYTKTSEDGTDKGFVATDANIAAYYTNWEQQSAEQKNGDLRGLQIFAESKMSGTDFSRGNLMMHFAQSGDMNELLTYTNTTNDKSVAGIRRALVDAATREVDEQFQANLDTWLEDDKNEQIWIDNDKQLPADIARQLRSSAEQQVVGKSPALMFQKHVGRLLESATQKAQHNPRLAIAQGGEYAGAMLEMSAVPGARPEDLAYFGGDRYRAMYELPTAEHQQRVEAYGEWGAFIHTMYKDLIAQGTKPEIAKAIIAKHNDIAVRLIARNDTQGGQVYRELEQYGLDTKIPLQVEALKGAGWMEQIMDARARVFPGARGVVDTVNSVDGVSHAIDIMNYIESQGGMPQNLMNPLSRGVAFPSSLPMAEALINYRPDIPKSLQKPKQ